MKKYILIITLLTMSVSLFACGKSPELEHAEKLISALNTISIDDETAILAAENAYAALSDKDKDKIEGHSIILDVRANFEQWKADKAKADEVIEQINSIGTITIDSMDIINDARTAYDSLTASQKEMVGNYDLLLNLENEYPVLAVETVSSAISNIGTVTLESGEIIRTAQDNYDKLDDSLQKKVNNHHVLESAKKALSQLKADNVSELIDAIDEVTLSSEDVIMTAELALSELNNTEIALVANVDDLVEFRNIYDELVAEEEKRIATEEARAIIQVSRIWVSKPDSAGGVSLYINFTNNAENTIKYLRFGATFYNAVDDIVTCDIEKSKINYCRATGPFEKGKGISGSSQYWGKYYSFDIKSVKLVYLEIEYMDGKKIELTPNQIEYVQYGKPVTQSSSTPKPPTTMYKEEELVFFHDVSTGEYYNKYQGG